MAREVGVKKLSDDDLLLAVDAYENGVSAVLLGQQYGVTPECLYQRFRALGVTPRPRDAARREYDLDEGAFDVLTPESRYWLGFLMADGCVCGTALTVALRRQDEGHLAALARFLGTSRPVRYVSQNGSAYLRVRSARLVAALAAYGVTPRKSLHAKALLGVDHHSEFWLGALDGDGWVGSYRGILQVGYCGSAELMEQCADFVAGTTTGHKGDRRPSVQRRHDQNVSLVTVYGKRARQLLEQLHSASPVCLGRKLRRWEEVRG